MWYNSNQNCGYFLIPLLNVFLVIFLLTTILNSLTIDQLELEGVSKQGPRFKHLSGPQHFQIIGIGQGYPLQEKSIIIIIP